MNRPRHVTDWTLKDVKSHFLPTINLLFLVTFASLVGNRTSTPKEFAGGHHEKWLPGAGCLPDAGGTARSHHLRCVFRGVLQSFGCLSLRQYVFKKKKKNIYIYIYILLDLPPTQ